MKKLKIGLGILVLTSMLMVTACGGGSQEASKEAGSNSSGNDTKVIEMNVNNTSTSLGAFAKNIYEPWKDLVEEKSNGRIKVNLYHGGALGNASTVLKDVKAGVYDVGLVWSPYEVDSEFFPITVGDLPFAATPDLNVNNKVINQYAEDYLESMGKDVKVMGIAAAEYSYLFSREPISAYSDLAKKKIRVVGDNEATTVKEWGGAPVSVSNEELYDSLQKGIIDIVNTSIGMAIDISLNEVTPYVLDVPYKTIQMIPVMSPSFYNKLPDDLKTLFDEELNQAMVDLVLQSNIDSLNTNKGKYAELISGKGEVTKFSAEEEGKLRSSVKSVYERFIEEANKKGYNGEEMINRYRELLEDAGGKLPY